MMSNESFMQEARKIVEKIPPSMNWEEASERKKHLITEEEVFSFLETYFNEKSFQSSHKFTPIQSEKLITLRKSVTKGGKPAISIVKSGEHYFYAPTLKKYNSIFCRLHLCNSCRNCRALPTNQGGCDKVLDISLSNSFYRDGNQKFHRFDFEDSKRLEKYSFILTGVEELGIYAEKNGLFWQCKGERFFVFHCKNFLPLSNKSRSSIFDL